MKTVEEIQAQLTLCAEEMQKTDCDAPIWLPLWATAETLKWVLNDSQTGRFDGGQDEQSQH